MSAKASAHEWLRHATALGACAIVLWFYAWSVRPAVSQFGNPTAQDAYYNLLVDGFLIGQLALNGQPRTELMQLANPYDPVQNSGLRLHDASYYEGKYYLYFGVTPVLVLFLPYRMITGGYIWHHEAVTIFCIAGFLTATGLLRAMRRRYFPAVGPWTEAALIVGLGLATGVPMLLRRPDLWEIPIACGSWLVLSMLAALWGAWHDDRRRMFYLALAAGAIGLAVGARPTLLFAGTAIPWCLWHLRRSGAIDSHAAIKLGCAALVPLSAIGLGLAAYNYLRFGNLLEFGQRYQLAGVEVAKLKLFGPEYFWTNLQLYLWAPTNWQAYFPFVRGIDPPVLPSGNFGIEQPYGVLSNMPFVWMALALPLAWRDDPAGILRAWSKAVVLAAVCCALPLMFFGGVTIRYLVDFAPLLVLLAAAGCLALEQRFAGWPGRRRLARLLGGGLLLFSIGFNAGASCEMGNWLRLRDPEGYRRLAQRFNTPVVWLEKWRGESFGPLELKVKFPAFTTRRVEPLLVTGAASQADCVWVEYLDANHVRFGVEHSGQGGPMSAVIEIDYEEEHVLLLELGSLYPPPEHPFWSSPAQAGRVTGSDRVRLCLDDREILLGTVSAYVASPWSRWVGRNPFAERFGTAFTGRIITQRMLAPPDQGVATGR